MTIMNWPKLQALTPKQRDFLLSKSAEVEARWVSVTSKYVQDQYELQRKGGVEVITLQGASAKKYMDMASETGWADVKQKVPQHYEKLRKMLE
jgi:TRAP-type C4-dicarboxylate transport system substrate-binding protein